MKQANQISLLVIGGFLGSGKTTTSTQLVKQLWETGCEAAYITNDQSTGLVDTAIAAAGGIAVHEIQGGCFCCKCDEFAGVLDEIAVLQEAEVIIAEAVGSCTDLVATVVNPLRDELQRPYRVLPVTIIVDPMRLEAAIETRDGSKTGVLNEDVQYIFWKQLEEAQIILLNKADLVPFKRIEELTNILSQLYPYALVKPFTATDSRCIRELWEYLSTAESNHRQIAVIDYLRYAEGEAALGWLNGSFAIRAAGEEFSCDGVALVIAEEIRRQARERQIEIAHLKISVSDLESEKLAGKIAVVQCVSTTSAITPVCYDSGTSYRARVLVNLRAQAGPTSLEETVTAAIASARSRFLLDVLTEQMQSFSPAAPKPAYGGRVSL